MRALPLAFLLTLGVAGAQPTPTQEPEQEQVTIPKAMLQLIIQENIRQKLINEKLIQFHKDWQVGTNCV